MKLRGTKDLSVATVGKYGTLQEFSFFDKVSICPFLTFSGLIFTLFTWLLIDWFSVQFLCQHLRHSLTFQVVEKN